MKERGFQSGKRYIASFLIGAVVFILVFALTYSISYLEFGRVSNLQADVGYAIFEDKLDYTLFDEPICTNESLGEVSRNLGFQGRIIDDLEKKLGKQNKEVLSRKKFYTLIELEHFEFVNLLNEKCDRNVQTILFFYSNEESNIKDSGDAGKLLSVVHSKTENLMIYSFDINLDSDLIEKLKEKYDVERSPTMIINGEFKVENPQNLLDVEVYLS
ncbi:MAG: hypothetical protein KJI71_04980 [Patescibacteria group bacterium]|nr:hypothetical protein [Patescibacteria group bacterium]